MNINKDDLFYVCTMIEYVSRRTHNKCKDIVAKIPDDELEHQLKVAEINHCLPFEQVSDEWIEQFGINNGTFDNITSCRYKVPSVTSIGRVYQRLIMFTRQHLMNCRKWLENKAFMRFSGNNEFHVIYRSFTLFFMKMGTSWGQNQ